jgi:hypothetical protein
MDNAPMPYKLITLLACLLAASNLVLIVAFMVNNDKVEALHDQLIASEARLESRTADYNNLLEKVGGADVPKVPYAPKRPGNLGDK